MLHLQESPLSSYSYFVFSLGTLRKHAGSWHKLSAWSLSTSSKQWSGHPISHHIHICVWLVFIPSRIPSGVSLLFPIHLGNQLTPQSNATRGATKNTVFQTTVEVQELCGTGEFHHHINRLLGKDFTSLSSVITIEDKIIYVYILWGKPWVKLIRMTKGNG